MHRTSNAIFRAFPRAISLGVAIAAVLAGCGERPSEPVWRKQLRLNDIIRPSRDATSDPLPFSMASATGPWELVPPPPAAAAKARPTRVPALPLGTDAFGLDRDPATARAALATDSPARRAADDAALQRGASETTAVSLPANENGRSAWLRGSSFDSLGSTSDSPGLSTAHKPASLAQPMKNDGAAHRLPDWAPPPQSVAAAHPPSSAVSDARSSVASAPLSSATGAGDGFVAPVGWSSPVDSEPIDAVPVRSAQPVPSSTPRSRLMAPKPRAGRLTNPGS